MDLSMVVPIYNEESNLLELANRIESAMNQAEITQWEVIFVNDGSTDRSQSVLLQLQQRDSRYRVVQFQINQGQTAAMDAGFRYARNPYVLTMDADLQNDPHDNLRIWRNGRGLPERGQAHASQHAHANLRTSSPRHSADSLHQLPANRLLRQLCELFFNQCPPQTFACLGHQSR